MKSSYILIGLTLLAVVSDYMIHPFYPQFFAERFGEEDPKVVGYFFAAICLMVMLSFPFWAQVSMRIAELKILVGTQLIAGLLALFCFQTTSYISFWVAALVMILFKGSYLLVYPYILKITQKKQHANIISMLSVIVHLGGVTGALIGGFTVDKIQAHYIFLFMALGDFLQMAVCWVLIFKGFHKKTAINPTQKHPTPFLPSFPIIKIALVTFILYFSDFLIRPFFASYWTYVSHMDSKFLAGTVYAIPGLIALAILIWNHLKKHEISDTQGIPLALTIGAIGMLLQGIENSYLIIIGRLFYGWAIFQADVRFDILLFQNSSPDHYAIDYSKVHFIQSLGVLLASFTTGILVDYFGFAMPFRVALVGFLTTLCAFGMLIYSKRPMEVKS